MWVSTSTFSVYLIHENIYIKQALWNTLDVARFVDSSFIVLVVLLLAVLIFATCTCLDKLLFSPVKRLISKEPFIDRLQAKFDSLLLPVDSRR